MDVFGGVLWGQADGGESFVNGFGTRVAGWRVRQQMERLGNQPVDTVAGVETAEGVLEHHLHFAAHSEVGFCTSKDRFAV